MAQELLTELHRRGVRLRLAAGGLEVQAPAGALTPELREQLRARREELLDLLRSTVGEDDLPQLIPDPEHRYDPFPLTETQHAYWIGRMGALELGGVATHLYFELERDGLDTDRLTDSLRRVIDRHDMLRAVVGPDGMQRVLASVPPYVIRVADLRGVPAAEREEALACTRSEMDHQVPDPAVWPLLDVRVSLMDGGRTRLHVNIENLVVDAASIYLLFEDWQRFYERPGADLGELPLTYRDHVLHQRALRESARYRRDERYWLDRLDELPAAPALPVTALPSDQARPRFTRRSATLHAERWQAMKESARRHGVTPSAALMTVFATVLQQWARDPAFTLNLTLLNRPPVHPRIGEVIGDFTSVTLLTVTAPGNRSFAQRAADTGRQLMRDLEHMSYDGVQVLRERARRAGGAPLAAMPVVFTSALVLAADDYDPSAATRFFGDWVYGITQTPQVWLDHQVTEEAGAMVHSWDAVEALFPPGLLDDMFAAYESLLHRLATDDDAWDETGPMLAPPRLQLEDLNRANDTRADIPERTLCGLFDDQARRRPHARAVLSATESVSYRELSERAHRLAHRLRDLGAAPGELVAVVLPKSADQVAAVLGVLRAGAAYLPIEPGWPAARRHELLTGGRVRTVVTSAPRRAEAGWPDGITLVTPQDSEVRAAPAEPVAHEPSPADLAYVIFTSGSTGRPKGVMIDHRAAANTVQDINRRFDVGPGDRILAVSALSFDLSVYDIFGMLAAGGAVVLPSPAGSQDPAHWSDLVERHNVTIWNSVPALMQAWMDAHRPALPPGLRLRLALLSGDWIPVTLPDAIRDVYPAVTLISLGGATEGSIWSIAYPIGAVDPVWTRIPYGRALANQTMHVYDSELRPRPVWAIGEIYIGGAGVALGYWDDPERTAARFLTHPETGERLYRTGDLGRLLPGGDIDFLGREDSQVKVNGYRIELGEIAAALRRQPGVDEALASVATHPSTGRRHLVGYVTPERAETGEAAPSPEDEERWRRVTRSADAEMAAASRVLAADLAGYARIRRDTEELCPAIMAHSLARLGAFATAGETLTADALVARCGLRPQYTGLLHRWLTALAEAGYLTDDFRADRPFDAERLAREVREGLARLRDAAGLQVLVDYVANSAAHHPELLRGTLSPLELLLPHGDWSVADALYAGNPVSAQQNRVIARAVRSRVEAVPGDRPARIVEVGAGTGATTAAVLPTLPADRIRYDFTDVSTVFTDRAQRIFAEHPHVSYGLLDIDRSPGEQGYPAGTADVVIAANVLHDARDLPATLRHLRSLLTTGGLLVMLEGTVNTALHLVTIGFIEGLTRQQNRDGGRPLLSARQWREALREAGFTAAESLPADDDVIDQHVVLGLAPGGDRGPDPETLRAGLQSMLPDYLVPQHYVVLDRLPLSANGKVDTGALPPPWDAASPAAVVAPRDEMEKRLYDIWREVLGQDGFGVEDDFFALGGDSLHAVQILGRMREELGMAEDAEEGLVLLLDSPTIAELATTLRALDPR